MKKEKRNRGNLLKSLQKRYFASGKKLARSRMLLGENDETGNSAGVKEFYCVPMLNRGRVLCTVKKGKCTQGKRNEYRERYNAWGGDGGGLRGKNGQHKFQVEEKSGTNAQKEIPKSKM